MSDPVLPLLVVILAALLTLGAVASLIARGSRQAIGVAGACLGGLGVLTTLLSLLLGGDTDPIELPLGILGLPTRLALDQLSAFFLLPAFVAGTAGIAFAAETGDTVPKSSLAGLALCLAGVLLAIIAADGVTLVLGLSLAGGAVWASGEPGRPRAVQLGTTAIAGLAILGATALGGQGGNAVPVQPAAAAVYVLALAGPGALAGLVPFQRWSIPAHRAAPSRVAALLSGTMQPLAFYLLLRLLLGGAGDAPAWWGLPLLAVGCVTALTGAWRAATEAEADCCLAGLTERQSGLTAIGIALALAGRANDVPRMAEAATGAVLLLVWSQALCGTLGQLAAGAVRAGAGSRQLVLLGGLIHSMPVTAWGMAAALYGVSILPVGAGFAALWLLAQAVLAAPPGLELALVAATLAVSGALSTVAVVRVWGIVFLGRPRGPRTAGAIDVGKQAQPPLIALAALAGLMGVFPNGALMLADAALRQVAGIGAGDTPDLIGFTVYPALWLVLLTLAVVWLVCWLLRRRGLPPARTGAPWMDGFAPTPPWLPFGDPLTQSAGAGFVPSLPDPRPFAARRMMVAAAWLAALVGRGAA